MPIEPIFIFDSQELWGPVAVEKIDEVPGVFRYTDRIDFPKDMKPVFEKPGVGYYRVVYKAGLYWHQYWLFYLYNPKAYWGLGKHEGDWEFVQLGCTDDIGMRPVLATASQHQGGGKKEYWRLNLKAGRPVFYVAQGSHANYMTPVDDVEDRADGKGAILNEIEWRPFGDWAMWPGRWGNSRGEGMSPESPGNQKLRWNNPHLFHGQAR